MGRPRRCSGVLGVAPLIGEEEIRTRATTTGRRPWRRGEQARHAMLPEEGTRSTRLRKAVRRGRTRARRRGAQWRDGDASGTLCTRPEHAHGVSTKPVVGFFVAKCVQMKVLREKTTTMQRVG